MRPLLDINICTYSLLFSQRLPLLLLRICPSHCHLCSAPPSGAISARSPGNSTSSEHDAALIRGWPLTRAGLKSSLSPDAAKRRLPCGFRMPKNTRRNFKATPTGHSWVVKRLRKLDAVLGLGASRSRRRATSNEQVA
jgi:hypothetical protein